MSKRLFTIIGVLQKVLQALLGEGLRLRSWHSPPLLLNIRVKKKLHWFTDNTSVVSVVHNGSRAVELQSPVLSISFYFCAISGFPLKWSGVLAILIIRLIIWVELLVLTTTLLLTTFFRIRILNESLTHWIGLPVITTPSFRALNLDFTNPTLKP